MKSCYYCNHYVPDRKMQVYGVIYGGKCSLREMDVLMWESCPECDTIEHDKSKCPQSKTCYYTQIKKTCSGSMVEYLEKGCGKPIEVFPDPEDTDATKLRCQDE